MKLYCTRLGSGPPKLRWRFLWVKTTNLRGLWASMVDKYPMRMMYNSCNFRACCFCVVNIFAGGPPNGKKNQKWATCGNLHCRLAPPLQIAILNYWDYYCTSRFESGDLLVWKWIIIWCLKCTMGKWPIFGLLFVGWLGSHHRLKYSLLCCTQHFKVIKTYVYCHFCGCWTPICSLGKWVPMYNI